MENYAIKNGLKYFCYSAPHEHAFIIEDITDKCVDYGQFITNQSLYHATIKECIEHLTGTKSPIYFNGQDINPIRDCEDIFLVYDPFTGECYRPIDWKKYYRLIDEMEN